MTYKKGVIRQDSDENAQRSCPTTHVALDPLLDRAGLCNDVLRVENAWDGLHLDLAWRPDAVLYDCSEEISSDSQSLPLS